MIFYITDNNKPRFYVISVICQETLYMEMTRCKNYIYDDIIIINIIA